MRVATAKGISDIDFDRIEVDVLPNARTVYRGIEELAQDIHDNGLLQPLIVLEKKASGGRGAKGFQLPDGSYTWTRYILIGGFRRHRAIQYIRKNLDKNAFARVAVTLRHGNEDDCLFDQLRENVQREDLSPADCAAAIVAMTKRGHTQSDIAKRLGKSGAWVSTLVSFHASASEPLRKAAAAGEISFTTARTLAALPEEEQTKEVAQILQTGRDTRRQREKETRTRVDEGNGKPTHKSLREIKAALETLTGTEVEGEPNKAKEPASWGAWRALQWVFGGAWPKEFGSPPKVVKKASRKET